MSEIWHNKKEKPKKLLHCTRLIVTKWGSIFSEKDIDNGAFIETDWTYLDDLLALETELERTRKALDVARHTIGWINQMIDEHTDKKAIKIKCEYALDQIKQITETKE